LSSSTPGPMVPSGSWMPTVNRYNPRFLSKEGTIRPQQIPVQIPTGNLRAIVTAQRDATGARRIQTALANLVSSVSLPVERFASSTEFLRRARSESPSCLVLDMRLQGMSGLDLQRRLQAQAGPFRSSIARPKRTPTGVCADGCCKLGLWPCCTSHSTPSNSCDWWRMPCGRDSCPIADPERVSPINQGRLVASSVCL
jgi:hypothetical protein